MRLTSEFPIDVMLSWILKLVLSVKLTSEDLGLIVFLHAECLRAFGIKIVPL